jgi:hypothetical protein
MAGLYGLWKDSLALLGFILDLLNIGLTETTGKIDAGRRAKARIDASANAELARQPEIDIE